jgi:hypothetical protein
VRVKGFDGEKTIRARRGVILATGHFTGNVEMLKKYTPRLLEEGITRHYTPFDDGAGHQLGAAAGGVLLAHGRCADHLAVLSARAADQGDPRRTGSASASSPRTPITRARASMRRSSPEARPT